MRAAPTSATHPLERGVAGPPALRLEPVPGRRPAHHDPLDVARHAETLAESAHAVGFRVGLGTQAVMHVDDGQREAERLPQRAEHIEERRPNRRRPRPPPRRLRRHEASRDGEWSPGRRSDEAYPDCSPTQTSPSSKCSFFQIGTVSFSVSMAKRHASKATAAMGRGHRDHHARLADLEAADAVQEDDARDRGPAAPDGRADLAHLGQGHRRRGASYSRNFTRRPPVWSRTTPEKSTERPRARMLHRLGHRALREGLGGHLDPVRPGPRPRRRSPAETGRARRRLPSG